MTNFNNSEIYKKALAEYQKVIFGKILNPEHVIIIDHDEVYLFYHKDIIHDVLEQLKDIYNKDENDEDTHFPISLGCEVPVLKEVTFMGNKYNTIALWYDGGDVPGAFTARI